MISSAFSTNLKTLNDTTKNKSSRLYELDCIRGIAALGVMLFHYTCRYQNLFGDSIIPRWMNFPIGRYGPEVFFILSGFTIIYTIEKQNLTFKNFISKRMWRLYPTYWLCTTITFIAVSLIGLPGREVTFGQYLINLTMLQFGLKISAVDAATWALFMILLFYFIIACILFLKKINKIEFICWCGLFLIVLKFLFPTALLKLLTIGDYGVFFIAGISFYHIFKTPRLNNSYHLLIICCFVTACILFREPLHTAALIVMFIAFYLFAFGKLKWLISKPLIFFGNISYPLYLLHQNIGYILIKKTASMTGQPYLTLLFPSLFSILAAWLVYRYFEGHILKTFFKERIYNV